VITRNELSLYLEQFLRCETFKDYAPNGIQVEGKRHIKKICTGVTASLEVITQAIDWQADALLVHHGYFWRGESAIITGMKRHRLSVLMMNDLNLFAYHLPIDCHPDLGNNACLADLFGVENIKMHPAGGIENLLWTGSLEKPIPADKFAMFLSQKLNRQPIHIPATQTTIQHIAWCSGGAQDYIENASQLGVDAYISGEVSERTYHQAKEMDIHYYACGHHATERFGIQALGNHLALEFNLDHLFIDSDNPI
jgi:dinuclear metal center YbgI/SA1388 family protein